MDIESIDIRSNSEFLTQFREAIRSGKLTFQFNETWNLTQKSKIIEKILCRIPLGEYIYIEENNGRGKKDIIFKNAEILEAIFDFTSNNFRLENLTIATDFNGKQFEDIPNKYKNRIEDIVIHFYTVDYGNSGENKAMIREILK